LGKIVRNANWFSLFIILLLGAQIIISTMILNSVFQDNTPSQTSTESDTPEATGNEGG
jgi:hypothetical protein